MKIKLIIGLGIALILGLSIPLKSVIEKKINNRNVELDYVDNRESIITDLRDALKHGEYQIALSLSNRYLFIKDDLLHKLNKEAKEKLLAVKVEQQTKTLLEKVNTIPESDYEQNLDLYQQLLTLNPNNKKYTEKVRSYKTKHILNLINKESQDKQKLSHYLELSKLNPDKKEYSDQVIIYTGKLRYEATLIKMQKEDELKQAKFRSQFSEFDGSHRKLVVFIKKRMNDPSSFEHVETTYREKGNHLIIKTRFRGKNALGALVINTITAKTSLDGSVLEIID